MDKKLELAATAHAVANLYRDGKLDHLRGEIWEQTWTNLCDEMEVRCPGFTRDEYAVALAEGFTFTR